MTLVSVSDDFNRANGAVNVSGGNWVGHSTTVPVITSNQVVAGPSVTAPCVRVGGHAGPQTSQATLVTVGTATTKAAVMVGVEDNATPAGSTYSWHGGAPMYRWAARTGDHRLEKKDDGASTFTSLATWGTGAVAGEVLKITYDPATGVLKGYVDGTERASYTDGSPVPESHTRIGFMVQASSVVDNWSGSWDVPAVGWAFSEWQGGTAPTGSEVSLTVDGEYNGSTVPDLDMVATTVVGDDTSTLPLVQPMWSDMIRDGFGINCHFKFGGSSSNVHYYVDQLVAYITELGCGWVRDRLVSPGSASLYAKQWGALADCAAAGVGLHVTLSVSNTEGGWQATTQSNITRYWEDIAAHPTWKWTVGGPNEPDDEPQITNWLNLLVAHMKMIYDTRAAEGMTAVPILSPSLKDGQASIKVDSEAMAASNGHLYVDYCDLHRYPLGGGKAPGDPDWNDTTAWTDPATLGRTPTHLMDLRLSWCRAAYHRQELISTEGGYNTDRNVDDAIGGEHLPADIDAAYKVRHLFELVGLRGVRRWFLYELMDDPDPSYSDAEAHRGLIYTPTVNPSSWTKKPAFDALKQVMSDCRDIGGGYDPITNPYVPPPVRLDVACDHPRFRHVVVAKRDGTVRLYYWLDVAMWDIGKDARIGQTSVTHEKIGNLPTGVLPGGTSGNTLSESSGFTCSRQHSNIVWCHNDSNADHLVFGLDYSAGMAHRKTLRMVGDGFTITDHGQMEDCAIDPTTNRVWIANSGTGVHEFTAYRFDEPASLGASGTVLDVTTQRYKFAWGSGSEAYDCEAMMCDTAGRVYFIPKHNNVGNGTDPAATGLWQAPASLSAWPTANVLTKVATIGSAETPNFQIGGADWAPDDSMFCVVKCATQIDASVETITTKMFDTASPWGSSGTFPLHVSHKANGDVGSQENICFLPDSSGLLVAVETPGAEVWLTRLNTGITAAATAETPAGVVNLTATPVVQSVVLS